jgi:hypothetical protein
MTINLKGCIMITSPEKLTPPMLGLLVGPHLPVPLVGQDDEFEEGLGRGKPKHHNSAWSLAFSAPEFSCGDMLMSLLGGAMPTKYDVVVETAQAGLWLQSGPE